MKLFFFDWIFVRVRQICESMFTFLRGILSAFRKISLPDTITSGRRISWLLKWMYSLEVQTSQNVKNGQQDLFMQVSGPPFTRKSPWIIMWLTKKYTLSISIRIFSVLSHLLWSCWVKWAWQRWSPTAAPQHWCTKWCRPSWPSRAKSPPGWRPRASWERDSSRMKGWIRVGNWKEQCRQAEPFGPDRVEIGSVAKKHRENGRTKEPWKWAGKKNLTSTDCVQSQHAYRGAEESQDHLYYFQLGHLHLHIMAELLN